MGMPTPERSRLAVTPALIDPTIKPHTRTAQTGGTTMRRLLTVLAGLLAVTACAAPSVNKGTISDAGPAKAAETTPAAPAQAPTWGKRYSWPDGLAVEVAAPVACKPAKYAVPAKVERGVKFTVTVVNGTDKPIDASMFGIGTDAQFAGRKAETITDIDGPCGQGFVTGTVLPGKTLAFDLSYAVTKAPGELQLAFQPGFGMDKAVFVGQA